jgi:hypothetical protein
LGVDEPRKLTPSEDKDITMIAKILAGTLISMEWDNFMKEMFLAQLRAEMEIEE